MSFNKRDGNAAQVAHGATRTLSRRDLLRTSAMIGLGFGLAPSLGWAAESSRTLPVRRRMVDALDGKFHVLEQGEGPAVLYVNNALIAFLAGI